MKMVPSVARMDSPNSATVRKSTWNAMARAAPADGAAPQQQRAADRPRGQEHRLRFDVVMEGQTSGFRRDADATAVAPYRAAGLTWWVEKLGWFRGPVDLVRTRIAAPPVPTVPGADRPGDGHHRPAQHRQTAR